MSSVVTTVVPLFSVLWTAVSAGGTQTVAANGMYAADSTGGLVTFNFPSAPTDGTVAIIKLEGSTVAQPVKLVAGAGDKIEDPQNAGSLSAAAGSVFISTIGAVVAFKYQTANTRWLICVD